MLDRGKIFKLVLAVFLIAVIAVFGAGCGCDDDDDSSDNDASVGSGGTGGGGGESGTPSGMDSGAEDSSAGSGGSDGGRGGSPGTDASTEPPAGLGDECSPSTVVDVIGECIAEDDDCEGGTSGFDRTGNCGEGLICCIRTDQCAALESAGETTRCAAAGSCEQNEMELPFGCPGEDVCCLEYSFDDGGMPGFGS
jgi:hypothetical protein